MRGFSRRRTPGRWLVLALAALLVWAALDVALWRPLRVMALLEARAAALSAVNRVVQAEIVGVTYGDLVRVVPDDQGRVAMLQADTAAMNRLVSRTASTVESEFRRLRASRIHVPLAYALRLAYLGSVGPRLPVAVLPEGLATAEVQHDFREAGINQTRHLITIEVRAQVRVVFPFVSEEMEVSARLPLAEAVIVGPVPFAYWKTDLPAKP